MDLEAEFVDPLVGRDGVGLLVLLLDDGTAEGMMEGGEGEGASLGLPGLSS